MEPDRQEAIELIQRADLIMLDRDTEEAELLLKQALEIDPLNAEAKRLLAGLHVRMAAAQGRVVDGAEMQAVHAGELADLIQCAREANANGQHDLAESLLHRALAIDPDHAEVVSLLSTTHVLQSQSRMFRNGI